MSTATFIILGLCMAVLFLATWGMDWKKKAYEAELRYRRLLGDWPWDGR